MLGGGRRISAGKDNDPPPAWQIGLSGGMGLAGNPSYISLIRTGEQENKVYKSTIEQDHKNLQKDLPMYGSLAADRKIHRHQDCFSGF